MQNKMKKACIRKREPHEQGKKVACLVSQREISNFAFINKEKSFVLNVPYGPLINIYLYMRANRAYGPKISINFCLLKKVSFLSFRNRQNVLWFPILRLLCLYNEWKNLIWRSVGRNIFFACGRWARKLNTQYVLKETWLFKMVDKKKLWLATSSYGLSLCPHVGFRVYKKKVEENCYNSRKKTWTASRHRFKPW